jgi:hypothetical protein
MRFMMLVKASRESEAGALPRKELLAAMGQFNEEMAKAGVLLAGEGLHASSNGARITSISAPPTGPSRGQSCSPVWMISEVEARRSPGPRASVADGGDGVHCLRPPTSRPT